MTIGARIYLVLGVSFLISLALAAIGLTRVNEIGEELREIAREEFPLTRLFSRAAIAQSEQIRNLEHVVRLTTLDGEKFEEEAAAAEAQFNILEGQIQALLGQATSLLTEHLGEATGEEAEEIEEVLSHLRIVVSVHDRYRRVASDVLSISRSGDASTLQPRLEELRQLEADLDRSHRHVLLLMEKHAKEESNQALEEQADSATQMIGLSAGGLVLAILLGLFLFRSINRPLTKLTASMELLSRGNLNIPIDLGSKGGEFGSMSNALEVFRKEMAGRAAADDRAKQFLDSAPDAMVVVDEAGKIVLVNAQAERLFGYPRRELLGESVEMLVPERFRADHPQNRARFHTDPKARPIGKGVDLYGVNKFGQEIPIELSLSPIETDEGLLITGAIRDITQRKLEQGELSRSKHELEMRVLELEDLQHRVEDEAAKAVGMAEALQDAKAQLSEAIESISEGFALWDVDDRLVMCNDRYRNMYPNLADLTEPGVTFEQFIRGGFERGVFSTDDGNLEEQVQERVERHRTSVSAFEQELGDGRWVRVAKRKTKSGRIVGILTDVSDRKESEATIQRLAMEDSLTGLPNRGAFHQRLTDALAHAERTGRLVGVMLLDLDHFKNVNDTLGHQAGDALLTQVAKRLSNCVRNTDTVARLGGDEFAVIATNTKEPDGITVLADRITKALGEPFTLDGNEVHSGTSIGITIFPFDRGDTDQLLRNADLALYRAKEEGRGAYQLYDKEMHTEVQSRRALEADLRLAIEREEFRLVYQPQLEMRTGRIIGAEALIRWEHPERGNVSPGEFIPIAETTRLIIPISDWVLRTACAQMKQWLDSGMPEFCVSVNISPLHFKQQNLIEQVAHVLKEQDLDARYLELEITEGMAMDERINTVAVLNGLKEVGVSLAIDDFGTGFSSLNRLKEFPVDRLKIDQSFVRDITTDLDDAAINSAVIRIGHSLSIKVIAEGVETLEQLEFLAEQGCDEMQGYYFSRPVPPKDFEEFVRKHDPQAVRAVFNSKMRKQRAKPGTAKRPAKAQRKSA
ncbi:MAG: EAL domain-containing protein [Minwuiales bacterium]|nr:EAL domain-containing protein [Minwuiales bacterium]